MTSTYLSRQLVTAIRSSHLSQRAIAQRVNVHESILSLWLHGHAISLEFDQYGERVRAIAALVGVPTDAAFSDSFDPSVARAPRAESAAGTDRERVSTWAPATLLEEFDDHCEELKMTRGEALLHAMRGFVAARKLAALRAEKQKCATA